MYYNQSKVNGHARPLLMGCTRPSKIEMVEDEKVPLYDPINQVLELDMRIVGTRSLRNRTTYKKKLPSGTSGHITDRKNEIADQKNVQ